MLLVLRGPKSSQSFSRKIPLRSWAFSYQVSPGKRRERTLGMERRKEEGERQRESELSWTGPGASDSRDQNPVSTPCQAPPATLAPYPWPHWLPGFPGPSTSDSLCNIPSSALKSLPPDISPWLSLHSHPLRCHLLRGMALTPCLKAAPLPSHYFLSVAPLGFP